MLSFFFGLVAFALLWASAIQCNFIKFTSTNDNTADPVTAEFGIWYYQSISAVMSSDGTFLFNSCHSYPDYMDIDSSWKTARAFIVLAFISSIIIITCNFLAACFDYSELSQDLRLESIAYLLTAIFQGLTLLLLNSSVCNDNILAKEFTQRLITFPDTCSMSNGAKLSISATVIWFAASVASFLGHRAYTAEKADGMIDTQSSSLTATLLP